MKKNKRQLKIRTKIMILYTILSAVLISSLTPVIYTFVRNALSDSLHTSMEESIQRVSQALYEKDGTVLVDGSKLWDGPVPSSVHILVADKTGNMIYMSQDTEWALAESELSVNIEADENGLEIYYADAQTDSDWMSVAEIVTVGDTDVTIIALGSVYFNTFLDTLYWIMVGVVPMFIIAAAVSSYFLARRALKPIRKITLAAQSINANDWSRRIEDVNSNDEVGDLANTFNSMMDELETSYKRERQFTSNAAHELRTPLAVIGACTEDALHTEDETIINENLQAIREENRKMSKMISQLLLLSRGYEGRMRFEPERICLYDMAESVSEELMSQADEKNISIHNEIPADITVTVDQSLFTQLLVNLTENAIKYGHEGGNVWFMASIEGEYVKIRVCDDGIGISQEDIGHIFERFYRADHARDRSGTGLGLSIVQWIVDIHGGQIYVNSQPGTGTAFVLFVRQ